MLDGIIAGVVANALFLIFLTALGASVTLILVVHTRRRRLRFLGIRRPVLTSQIPIFIAHLVVVKGGALLADGTPSEYFEGSAVPIKEVQAAERVQKMLKPVAGLEYLPLALRSRLERLSVGLTTIELPVSPAPLVINDFANISHLIVIGGPEFNKAAEHFMERGRMFRVLDPAECEQPTIALITDAGEDLITPDSADYNLGIVQRVSFDDGRQVVLLLSDIGTNGTLSAVDWFVKNWDALEARVGSANFGVCLQCPRRTVDADGWRRWQVRRLYPDRQLTGWQRDTSSPGPGPAKQT